MRNCIITLLIFLSALVVCTGQDLPSRNSIPERLADVKETVFYLDSAANSLTGWDDEIDSLPVEDIKAKEKWEEFKRLCEMDKYEKALDFYLEDPVSHEGNFADFIVFLKHSTNQYIFASDVLRPLLFEYCDRDVAFEEYISILEFQKEMEDMLIEFNKEGNGYVPETYAYVVRDLGYAMAATGRGEEALAMLDDFAFGVSQVVDSPLKVNFSITIYVASIAIITGDYEDAIGSWEDFKKYHLAHGDEYDLVELEVCLQQADEQIAEIKVSISTPQQND